jgi:hypothetical protein
LVGTLIFTVLLVAARHNCQSQQVETEYECQNFFHGANVSKKFVCLAQNCRVALVRLGKIKCAAKVGRLMGGFAALFILRRESQTALPKIALSVGFCLAVRVALSDRVADNSFICARKQPYKLLFGCIGAVFWRNIIKVENALQTIKWRFYLLDHPIAYMGVNLGGLAAFVP